MPVAYDPQVLHIIAFFSENALLPVQSVLDQLMVRVDVVKDSISIGLMRCSKNYYLEVLVGLLQALHYIGPYIYTCLLVLMQIIIIVYISKKLLT